MKKFLLTLSLCIMILGLYGQALPFPIGNTSVHQYGANKFLDTKLTSDSTSFTTNANYYSFNRDIKIKGKTTATQNYVSNSIKDTANVLRDIIAASDYKPLEFVAGYSGSGEEGDHPFQYNPDNMPIRTTVSVGTTLSRQMWLPVYSNRRYLTVVPTFDGSATSLDIRDANMNPVADITDSVLLEFIPTSLTSGAWKVVTGVDLSNYYTKLQTRGLVHDSLINYAGLNKDNTFTKTAYYDGSNVPNTYGAFILSISNSDKTNINGLGIGMNSSLPALSVDNTGTGYAIDAFNYNCNDNYYLNDKVDTMATKAYVRSQKQSVSDYVTLTTAQTITGKKQFNDTIIATKALKVDKLGFGDSLVVYNKQGGKSYYLNTNTASSIQAYADNSTLTTGGNGSSIQAAAYNKSTIMNDSWGGHIFTLSLDSTRSSHITSDGVFAIGDSIQELNYSSPFSTIIGRGLHIENQANSFNVGYSKTELRVKKDSVNLYAPLTLKDKAVVYEDVNTSVASGKTGGANTPTWSSFTTNTSAYTFAVNDYIDLATIEVPHCAKEGDTLFVHLHMANNGVDVTARAVKYEIFYTYALPDNGTQQFSTESSISYEQTIPANTPDKSAFYIPVGIIYDANMKVGTQIKMRLKRIASTGTAPTNNPFLGQVGVHYKKDSEGSRYLKSK